MIIDPYRWHTVRVTQIAHESTDAVSVQTERPAGYIFESGQHAIVRITLPDGTQRLRQYSFAGSPAAKLIQFVITRAPHGEVSSWFIDTSNTASLIEISQPFTGPLHLNIDTYSHVGMIAGGSGIAPMLSYIHTLREHPDSPARTLLYTTRSTSLCAANVLQETKGETILVRQTDVDGRLTHDEIIRALGGCDLILVCGSRQFVTELHALCTLRLPDVTVRAEAFSLN
ncbi:MAG: hypothetical protein ABIQ64_03635 [Candidatus Saccharimonadales bacterium]